MIYCLLVGLTFSVIKIINYRMHLMFDVGEQPKAKKEGSGEDDEGKNGEKSGEEGLEEGHVVSSQGVHIQLKHIE